MQIGKYKILKSIGKGGMGEVFLAHDPTCDRNVALKKMLEKWIDNPSMQERFFQEAKIAAGLAHPSIIPIHSIVDGFYTMTHIEGETLKEIIKQTAKRAKGKGPPHPIGHSIPNLIRIFLSICNAVAYAHSRGVLHRDLKPENIMVGKFSEVIILDWGLARLIDDPNQEETKLGGDSSSLTQPGKLPGTILYMPPERAFGKPANIQTDIYALGVVLYSILTLKLPFKRESIKEFRKNHHLEQILSPEEMAPEREISPQLSKIVGKCLVRNPKKRYQSVQSLITDLEHYIEGTPEWQVEKILKTDQKKDWQFQENVAIGKHMALSKGIDTLEWFNLMVSKKHFPGNIRLTTNLRIDQGCEGIGLLFCIPSDKPHLGLEQSYCLWLSSQSIQLYRSNVEVIKKEEIALEKGREYHLQVELVDRHIRLLLDGVQLLEFYSHIPLRGTLVGLLTQGGSFFLDEIEVAIGSQSSHINCLSIPDAFLSRNLYKEALEEYRKIARSFPRRAEGREATYWAGLTLLLWAQTVSKEEQDLLLSGAFVEFEKLHNTPGAPLEYLGKSQIYKFQADFEDEVKSLELALRKFPRHPLTPILEEYILSRLNEATQTNRLVGSHFALLLLRLLPHLAEAAKITSLLEKTLEPLPFFTPSKNQNLHLIIQLAFWLNSPHILIELSEQILEQTDQQNVQIALLLIDSTEQEKPFLPSPKIFEKKSDAFLIQAHFEYALKENKSLPLEPYPLWNALAAKDNKRAKEIIDKLDPDLCQSENSPYFFLFGSYLALAEGKEKALAHLSSISDTALPSLNTLLSHFLKGKIDPKGPWGQGAFPYEKRRLAQELALYEHCLST